MKLQGSIRRTLALLLVFIFAMSNMGLAEMVEQASQIVEEPVVVEPVVEEPVVEEPAPDASEPEVVEEVVSEPEVVEPDDAETEAEGDAPVEEAPEQEAPEVVAPAEVEAPELFVPAEPEEEAAPQLMMLESADAISPMADVVKYEVVTDKEATTCTDGATHQFETAIKKGAEDNKLPDDFDWTKGHPMLCKTCEAAIYVEPHAASAQLSGKEDATAKTCSVCDYSCELHDIHPVGVDATNHKYECSICHAATADEAHTYDAQELEDETGVVKCKVCASEESACAHDFSQYEEIPSDHDYHKVKCSKCQSTYKAKHEVAAGSGTLEEKKEGHTTDTCSKCSATITLVEGDWKQVDNGAGGHVWECQVCHNKSNDTAEDHVPDGEGKCSVCDAVMASLELGADVELVVGAEHTFKPTFNLPGISSMEFSYSVLNEAGTAADTSGAIEVLDRTAGKIKAVKPGVVTVKGTVTFTAGETPSEISDTVKVTVIPALTAIKLMDGETDLTGKEVELIIGAKEDKAKKTLTVVLDPADAKGTITAEGSDEHVTATPKDADKTVELTVGSSATPEDTPTTITVKCGEEIKATVNVVVKAAVDTTDTNVTLGKTPIAQGDSTTLKLDDTVKGYAHSIKIVDPAPAEGLTEEQVKAYLTSAAATDPAADYDYTITAPAAGAANSVGTEGKDFKVVVTFTDFDDKKIEKDIKVVAAPTGIEIKNGETAVDTTPIELYKATSVDLTVKATGEADTTFDKAVTYETSDESITVTSKENEGTYTIAVAETSTVATGTVTFHVAKQSKVVNLKVNDLPTIKLDQETITMGAEETGIELTATVTPATYAGAITWSKEGTSAANVTIAEKDAENAKGVYTVTANTATTGEVTATATLTPPDKYTGTPITAVCKITVMAAPTADGMTITYTGIDATEKKLTVGQSATVTFGYDATKTAGHTMKEKAKFESADEKGAVDVTEPAATADPFIYTIKGKTAGKVTVTMTAYNGVTRTDTITVVNAITDVDFSEVEAAIPATLGVGESFEIKSVDLKITPETDVDASLVQLKGNDYLTVEKTADGWKITGAKTTPNNKKGKITAVVPGANGADTKVGEATQTITVKAAPTGISLDKTEVALAWQTGAEAKQDEVTLTASLAPSNSSCYGKIDWKSSDDTLVSVTQDATNQNKAKIVAIKAPTGTETVTITASVYNNNFDPRHDGPDDHYLTATAKVTVTTGISTSNESGISVTVEPDKRILAVDETVKLTAELPANYGGTVEWITQEYKANVKDKKKSVVIKDGVLTAQKRISSIDVWPVINGIEFESKKLTFQVVSRIEGMKFVESTKTGTEYTSYTFHVVPTKGYAETKSTPMTVSNPAQYDHLFSFTVSPAYAADVETNYNAITITPNRTGTIKIKAKAPGSNGKTISKSIKIGQYLESVEIEGGDVRLAVGEKVTLKAIKTPAKATPSLTWKLAAATTEDEAEFAGYEFDGNTADITDGTVTLNQKGKFTTTEATKPGYYKVTVQDGDDGASDSIIVEVEGYPTQNTDMEIVALRKAVGGFEDEYTPAPDTTLGSLSLPDGLKLGKGDVAYLDIHYENPTTAGSVTWYTSDKKIVAVDKKTGKITAKKPGTATITALSSCPANKGKKWDDETAIKTELNVTVGKVASDMVAIDPSAKKVTLGHDEEYVIKFNKNDATGTPVYDGTGFWYDVTANNSGITYEVDDTTDPDFVKITVTGNADSGTSKLTIKPSTGKTKTITFTLKPDMRTSEGFQFVIEPQDENGYVKLVDSKKQTIRLSVPMGSGWGNIEWRVDPLAMIDEDDGTVINSFTSAKKVSGIEEVKFKFVSNNTIEIQTTKNVGTTSFYVQATAHGYSDISNYVIVDISPDQTYTPTDFDTIQVSKSVVGVGERFTATMPLLTEGPTDGSNGFIVWSAKNAKVVDAYNGVFEASAAGKITLIAKVNGEEMQRYDQVQCISKLKSLSADRTIKWMDKGETAELVVTVKGYEPSKNQSVKPDYTGVFTLASTDESKVTVSFTGPEAKEEVETPAVVDGKLKLYVTAVEDTYNYETEKDEPATISLTAYNGKKLTMKISVNDNVDLNGTVSGFAFGGADKKLHLRLGDKLDLSEQAVLTVDSEPVSLINTGINTKWEFVGAPVDGGDASDAANAAAVKYAKDQKITINNGIVKTGDKTKAGNTVYIKASFYFNDTLYTETAQLIIEPKTTAGDMTLKVTPNKSKIAVGELLDAEVEFTKGYMNHVSWSSSNKKHADAGGDSDGRYGWIEGVGKGKATVTVKDYSGKAKLKKDVTVVAAPTTARFVNTATTLPGDGEYDFDVELPGYTGDVLTGDDEKLETLYYFVIEEDDDPVNNSEGTEHFTMADDGGRKSGVVKVDKMGTYDVTATLYVYFTSEGYNNDPIPAASIKLKALGSTSAATAAPKGIKLGWSNWTDSEAFGTKPVELTEGESMTAYALVSKENSDFSEANLISDAAVTWTSDDATKTGQPHITLDAATGKLTANKYTANDDVITITATAAPGVTATYQVKILPKLSENHFTAELDKETIGINETAELTLGFKDGLTAANPVLAGKTFNVTGKNVTVTKKAEGDDKVWTIVCDNKNNAGKTGTLTITFGNETATDVTFTKTIAISQAPSSLKIKDADGKEIASTDEITLGVGESFKVTTTLKNYTGVHATAIETKVDPDATGVITVAAGEPDGTWTITADDSAVTEVKAETITFTAFGLTASFKVNVLPKPTAINVKAEPVKTGGAKYGIDETIKLTAEITPAAANDAYWLNKIEWSTNNAEAIELTAGESGTATVVGKDAAASVEEPITVTAKIGETYTSAPVTLGFQAKPSKTDVKSFNIDKTSIIVGETATATLTFNQGKECSYTWSIESEANAATIEKAADGTGTITGKAEGTATVKATAYDGTELATGTITVTDSEVKKVEIDLKALKEQSKIEKDGTAIVTAKAYDAAIDGKEVVTEINLISRDEETITVEKVADLKNTWKITGVKEGSTFLTASAGAIDSPSVLVTVTAASEASDELNVTIKTLLSSKVRQATDTALKSSRNNQDQITVSGPTEDGVITFTGDLSKLETFNASEASHKESARKWVGVIVNTGLTSLTEGLTTAGIEFTANEETEAHDVGGDEHGSFVMWIDAEDAVNNAKVVRLEATGKKPKTLIFTFKNEQKQAMTLTANKIDAAKVTGDEHKALYTNQFLANVTTAGNTVTVSADEALLQATSADSYVGGTEGKLVGLLVTTPATSVVDTVSIDGKKIEADDVTNVAALGGEGSDFLIWVKATAEKSTTTYRVEMDGYAPALLTVEFNPVAATALMGKEDVAKLEPKSVTTKIAEQRFEGWNQQHVEVATAEESDGKVINVTITGFEDELVSFTTTDETVEAPNAKKWVGVTIELPADVVEDAENLNIDGQGAGTAKFLEKEIQWTQSLPGFEEATSTITLYVDPATIKSSPRVLPIVYNDGTNVKTTTIKVSFTNKDYGDPEKAAIPKVKKLENDVELTGITQLATNQNAIQSVTQNGHLVTVTVKKSALTTWESTNALVKDRGAKQWMAFVIDTTIKEGLTKGCLSCGTEYNPRDFEQGEYSLDDTEFAESMAGVAAAKTKHDTDYDGDELIVWFSADGDFCREDASIISPRRIVVNDQLLLMNLVYAEEP